MYLINRFFALLFLLFLMLALWQCAKRGNPTGGPKDITAPVLVRAEPPNLTTEFRAERIRLYFDEYITLEDIQNQLIISPPLKNPPQISPQGGASKYVEILIKDTLRENTTYTFNFGESIVDNNEGNPNPLFSYVFSTGTYIDSLTLSGVVRDAFNKVADSYVSVMLYEIDTAYSDSAIYKYPPNYITNTLDSNTIFQLNYLKAGSYALFALKDADKNNIFNQKTDKIGFNADTIQLPTDSVYLLTLFKEVPDYNVSPPNYAASNKIIFGYAGGEDDVPLISPLTPIPDSVRTMVAREPGKDTLNYWFTPFTADSLVFTVLNSRKSQVDTFSVKTRKLPADSLVLTPSHRGSISVEEDFYISANIPIITTDTSKISMRNNDSLPVSVAFSLDSIQNRLSMDFKNVANENYSIDLLPGAIADFFGNTNDTLGIRLSTGSSADLGNLRLQITGDPTYPLIIQLTSDKAVVIREIYAPDARAVEFNSLDPGKYMVRVILDTNKNGKWDTGNYLKRLPPEQVIYYLKELEVRANWELEETFVIE